MRSREQCQLDSDEWPEEASGSLAFGLATESRTFYFFGSDQAAVE